LSAITVGEWVLKLLGRHAKGYIINWDQLDLSDPRNPTLKVNRSDLKHR
jgi:hypothetical protein